MEISWIRLIIIRQHRVFFVNLFFFCFLEYFVYELNRSRYTIGNYELF